MSRVVYNNKLLRQEIISSLIFPYFLGYLESFLILVFVELILQILCKVVLSNPLFISSELFSSLLFNITWQPSCDCWQNNVRFWTTGTWPSGNVTEILFVIFSLTNRKKDSFGTQSERSSCLVGWGKEEVVVPGTFRTTPQDPFCKQALHVQVPFIRHKFPSLSWCLLHLWAISISILYKCYFTLSTFLLPMSSNPVPRDSLLPPSLGDYEVIWILLFFAISITFLPSELYLLFTPSSLVVPVHLTSGMGFTGMPT